LQEQGGKKMSWNRKKGLYFFVAMLILIFTACNVSSDEQELNLPESYEQASEETVELEEAEELEDLEEPETIEEMEEPVSPSRFPSIDAPQEPGNGLHWVGAWSTAMYYGDPSNSGNQGIRDAGVVARDSLPNSTIRQLIRPAIGGETVRLTFSNEFGETPLTINAVNIAIANGNNGTSNIDTGTNTTITFNGGEDGVVIPAGEFVTSDSVVFPMDALERVAVSIYFGELPERVTSHIAARANSFIEPGNATLNETITGRSITNWFVLCNFDVLKPEEYRSIVAIGDSITDGFGITNEQYLRWVDILMNNLQAHESPLSVINMGIGGNGLVGSANSNPPAVRYLFERDVLRQPGVGYVVIQIGVNNLAFSPSVSTDTMIEAYTELIEAANAQGINVFIATITPYTPDSGRREREEIRNAINEWMRRQYADGIVYGLLDFDMLLRDPENHARIQRSYDRDGIHPNNDGYRLMGEALFEILYP